MKGLLRHRPPGQRCRARRHPPPPVYGQQASTCHLLPLQDSHLQFSSLYLKTVVYFSRGPTMHLDAFELPWVLGVQKRVADAASRRADDRCLPLSLDGTLKQLAKLTIRNNRMTLSFPTEYIWRFSDWNFH